MSVLETLKDNLPAYREAIDAADIDELTRQFAARLQRATPGTDEHAELVFFLIDKIGDRLEERHDLDVAFNEFNQRLGIALSPVERRVLILGFSEKLGATQRQLRQDRRAFARFFGPDAVTDRYVNRTARIDRDIALMLDRLGYAAQRILARTPVAGRETLWTNLGIEDALSPVLAHQGDPRVQQATFSCLATALRGLEPQQREQALGGATLRYVYRSALQRRSSVWTQIEALDLLGEMSRTSFEQAVRQHQANEPVTDGLFVRARIVHLGTQYIDNPVVLLEIARNAAADVSPHVRQAVCECLARLPDAGIEELVALLLADDETCVLASVLSALPDIATEQRREMLQQHLESCFSAEADPGIVRLAFIAVVRTHHRLQGISKDSGDTFSKWALPQLARARSTDPRTRVRRWAGLAGERLWLQSNDARMTLHDELQNALCMLRPGQRKKLPVSLVKGMDPESLGRILSLLAETDHGFDVEFTRQHLHVYRGHVFRGRLWRIIYELTHSATDKRQGYRHTIGRHFFGTLITPSSILCEQARTKVPGEPLYIEDEDGWRPFLPLVDNLIGALDRGYPVDTVRIVTTDGVTEILPPISMIDRIKARWILNRRFAEFAELRNWQPEDAGQDPDAYVTALHTLGFRLRFRPHDWQADNPDERVQQFFPGTAVVALPLVLPDVMERAQDYFYSLYQNTLSHLAIFLAGMATLFFSQHLFANLKIRSARKSIAMVIGGWGTRGKSGTERLKAGLFNGLGYSMVSKTSGCEAMFIFSRPYGRSREMFLFRPYDKATIWEQANLLGIAQGLKSEVFLWECMALTPSYVEILQRQWMRDDYSTITNAYPDHEDIQGPAGINIPEVIGNFIPRGGHVVTTEEFMVPILRAEAHRVGSEMVEVGWQEAIQIAPDILSRFPYDEHPYNIALVVRLAAMLGISRDFALKEMADRVIADLGVLKTFPTASVRSREIEFVNGFSANERFGSLGNFRRMGFDTQDPVKDPHVWVVTVVNNRGDRVARSKVFASILVSDVSADRHLLIGSNLNGFRSYVEEAWEEAFGDFSLGDVDGPAARTDAVENWLLRFRVPFRDEHLQGRLNAMDNDHPETEIWAERFRRQYEEAAALLANAGNHGIALDKLETDLVRLLHKWFDEKIDVVEDTGATGEQVVDRLVKTIPPTMHARVMGIQNIKGTGLDFMYRWLALETVDNACKDLVSDDPRRNEEGLQLLLGFQEFGLLSEDRVRDALASVRERPDFQLEAVQAQLMSIEKSLDDAINAVTASLDQAQPAQDESANGWFDHLLGGVEQILDSFDAVSRRRRADLIYRELVAERIGPDRASLELQLLNKRQKGGWLKKKKRR